LVRSIINGLANNPKFVPSMTLYDNRGLQLFEKVTYTDEYYINRCEIDILNKEVDQITEFISSD
ncbi:7837_t:CDS:1, partial [Racocetra fulgida]